MRNEMIADDIVRALGKGRCPLLLTGRTEHLQYFARRLQNTARHVFVLKGGMAKKQRQLNAQELTSLPPEESRVILATGSYIGEGLTMHASTPCFLPCRFHGKAPCSNT